MDIFLPWANAILVEQIHNELPVKWTDLVHGCSTVKDLALELVEFFDINIHWKHRELYDAFTVVAGLKKTEDKNLNSLDLRLRVETLLDMKLKGEDFQTRREYRQLGKETKITDNRKDTQTEQAAETSGSRGKEKKRKKKKRDPKKVQEEKKRSSRHLESAKEEGGAKRNDLSAVETGCKERTRKVNSAKETTLPVIDRNIKKQIHVHENESDVRTEPKERSSIRKMPSEMDVKKDNEKERNKRDSVLYGNYENREETKREINNNTLKRRSNKELSHKETHRSYGLTEEWDSNTEEFVV